MTDTVEAEAPNPMLVRHLPWDRVSSSEIRHRLMKSGIRGDDLRDSGPPRARSAHSFEGRGIVQRCEPRGRFKFLQNLVAKQGWRNYIGTAVDYPMRDRVKLTPF